MRRFAVSLQKTVLFVLCVLCLFAVNKKEAYAATYIFDYDGTSFVEEITGENVERGSVFVEGDVIKAVNGGCSIVIEDGLNVETYDIRASEQFTFGRGTCVYKIKDDGIIFFERVNDGQTEPAENNENELHQHTYITKVQTATETQDGRIEIVCEECGCVKESGPVSALDVFWANAFERVQSAMPGDTVIIESEIWYSLPAYVMETVAARRDISVICRMEYERQKYEIVISPEEKVEYTDKYYGVLYLSQLYGGTIIE